MRGSEYQFQLWISALLFLGILSPNVYAHDSLATKSPPEIFATWRQALRQEKFEVAWECLSPKMQDSLTAELAWTISQLGGERGQALVQEHVRGDAQALEAEIERKRAARPRRPGGPTPEDLHAEILSMLKDKRSFFLAASARYAEEGKKSKQPPPAIPELQLISQGNWARGSYWESPQQRENIDFVKTAAGWRVNAQWREQLTRRPTPADYVKPKSLAFVTPQAAFEAYAKARLAADWPTAWACLTPQLQDQAAYEALYELSQRDPHFDKIYLVADSQPPGPNANPEEQRRLLLASIKDKFACYAAARDFQAVHDSDAAWKEPLRNIVTTGERARGVVSRTIRGVREQGGVVSTFTETVEQPHHFKKTATGWLLDLPVPGSPAR